MLVTSLVIWSVPTMPTKELPVKSIREVAFTVASYVLSWAVTPFMVSTFRAMANVRVFAEPDAAVAAL